jgi:hypothetical protein
MKTDSEPVVTTKYGEFTVDVWKGQDGYGWALWWDTLALEHPIEGGRCQTAGRAAAMGRMAVVAFVLKANVELADAHRAALESGGCKWDTDGDGNCGFHKDGCPKPEATP